MTKSIRPDLFAKIMALPLGLRKDLLEVLGGSTIEDTQLSEIIANLTHPLSGSAMPAQRANINR